MKSLKSSSILTALDRWTVFDKSPKDQDCPEDAAFKPIPDLFKKVVDAIILNSQTKLTKEDCSIDFLQNPNRAPTSAERYNASRPDGYMLVNDRLSAEVVSWSDVVLSCEYKRKDGDEELDDVSAHEGL
jgi:RecB family endonuclease NucS